ncbi:MAG TPA: YHS domain-containing (seleno)protein [Pyrinomonadaceae bacterium]|nr:YHS domain-containing (seleno)protein [Pyrinomonadaceae bacterium]
MKIHYIAVLIGIAIALAGCGKTGGVEVVNKAADGLALRGFDTVAYFAVDKAVKGDPKYEYAWNGAKWLFSSAENLEKFKLDPDAYAPQYGGYCSYAVSHGYTADGDPEAWKLVDGKLYLNYNEKAKSAWEREQERNIEQGKKNWVEFKSKKPEHKS